MVEKKIIIIETREIFAMASLQGLFLPEQASLQFKVMVSGAWLKIIGDVGRKKSEVLDNEEGRLMWLEDKLIDLRESSLTTRMRNFKEKHSCWLVYEAMNTKDVDNQCHRCTVLPDKYQPSSVIEQNNLATMRRTWTMTRSPWCWTSLKLESSS